MSKVNEGYGIIHWIIYLVGRFARSYRYIVLIKLRDVQAPLRDCFGCSDSSDELDKSRVSRE
jgi:hypothetical protein